MAAADDEPSHEAGQLPPLMRQQAKGRAHGCLTDEASSDDTGEQDRDRHDDLGQVVCQSGQIGGQQRKADDLAGHHDRDQQDEPIDAA